RESLVRSSTRTLAQTSTVANEKRASPKSGSGSGPDGNTGRKVEKGTPTSNLPPTVTAGLWALQFQQERQLHVAWMLPRVPGASLVPGVADVVTSRSMLGRPAVMG